ncbi:DUF2767 family protein [Rahnella perminowiae]|uniref:DUF2767 family protein n=1 Tax=Rahnella perminowiae TaxID=2816244 RepID=UPI00215CD0CD|nr:DUF2767 family protein [Rahnella perminowiae]
MSTEETDQLYDQMCRIVGDLVFTLHDLAIEPKHIVIADLLRTALTAKVERPESMITCMKVPIKVLETYRPA